jgi:hypothetical protein
VGLISDILLAPITGPVHGLKFVLNAIRENAEAESHGDEQSLREELVALNMRLELGEVSEEDFQAQEAAVLEKLKAIRAESGPPEAH